jgi:hypothetical protein
MQVRVYGPNRLGAVLLDGSKRLFGLLTSICGDKITGYSGATASTVAQKFFSSIRK